MVCTNVRKDDGFIIGGMMSAETVIRRLIEDDYQPSEKEIEEIRQTLNKSTGVPAIIGPYRITSMIG